MSLPAHRLVRAAERSESGPRLYVLHGFLGSGRNWSSFARRLVELRPDWCIVLVDLRLHGDSRHLPGPNTIAAAARDVVELHEAAGDPERPAAVLGHSLGGKVALEMTARLRPPPRQTWIIDSSPSPAGASSGAARMIERLEASPETFAERKEAVTWIMNAGFEEPLARWMATNLEDRDGAWVWRLDASALRELLEDFGARDMWGVVESPPVGADIHFVRATRGTIMTGADADRLRAAEARGVPVSLHEVEGAHWLHIDNPDELLQLVADRLPRLPS